nr:tetratricopeptide repeat protein [uncultured Campylobacter sp.]
MKKKCNDGDVGSCGFLGALYNDGEKIQKDISKAILYYDKACNGGHELSCGLLSDMYQAGKGVKMDITKAAVYYKKGCDLNSLLSCSNFANFNYYIANDKKKATEYYKKACDLGKNKKNASLIKLSPEFKEIWQKSCDMYEIGK